MGVETAIDAQFNLVNRRVLGAEYSTAMEYELGCVSQRLRADAAALKHRTASADLVLGKEAAKTRTKEYVVAAHRRHFEAELTPKHVGHVRGLAEKGRTGLLEHLRRVCPCGPAPGPPTQDKIPPRRASPPGELARMAPHGGRAAASRCPCCNAGVEENVRHELFECGPGVTVGTYGNFPSIL